MREWATEGAVKMPVDGEPAVVRAARDYAEALMQLENVFRERQQLEKAYQAANARVEEGRALLLKTIEETTMNKAIADMAGRRS